MSGRILITTFGSYGDVNPYLVLAHGLQARGHRVTFATSPFYREYIERAGVAFLPVRPDANPNDRELLRRVMARDSGTEFLLREILFPSVRDTFDDVSAAARNADLIVTHPATYAAHVVAERSGLPWVSTMIAPMGFFSAHDLPVFPPMPWAKHLERVPGAARLLVRAAKAATRSWPEPVYALRRELGMPPAASPIFEGQHSPQAILCLFSSLLAQPQPDWPAHTHVAGFLFHDRSSAMPETLVRFLDDGPPPIVFTLGSSATATAGNFYRHSIEAARRVGRRAVLLTGSHPENRSTEPLPADVCAVEHAPHELVFARAAAVVHQAGIGTLAQAMRAGVPMLITPHSHDQPDNAWRARALGIADILYPHRYEPRRAARRLARLLEDTDVRASATRVGAAIRAEPALTQACAVIEAALR